MKKKSGTNAKNKLILFIFLMCLLVVGGLVVYYQYMRKQQMQGMEKVPTTEAEKLIAKDMEVGYPETPTELLKLWGRINQCIYNTDLNDEEQEALFRQLRMMYSSELLEQNEESTHMKKFTDEVEEFQDNKYKIVNFSVDKGANVQYKTINKSECADIHMYYFIKKSGKCIKNHQDFALIKEDDKWKVLGFQQSAKDEEVSEEEATGNN